MSRKTLSLMLSAFLVLALMFAGTPNNPSQAAGPTRTPKAEASVSADISGIIQTITAKQITLSDGITVQITRNTKMPTLKVGQTVTITAELDGEEFTAISIVLGSPADDADQATPAATPAGGQGNGQGNGNGNTGGKGKGNNSSDDAAANGSGQGNGNANNNSNGGGKNNGNGNAGGKGKGNNSGDDAAANGNGKGKGKNNAGGQGNGKGNGNGTEEAPESQGGGSKQGTKDLAGCLKNTKQPVALQLSKSFNVSYGEIMTLHCQGNGFAEIAKAYFIAQKSSLTVAQIFARRDSGMGWEQIAQEVGLSQNDVSQGVHLKHNKGKQK
jgi:hypothetical protein